MKKFVSTVLACTLIASLAAGCGEAKNSGADSSGAGTSQQTSESKDSKSGKKQELTMWGSWSGDQVGQLEQQLKSYNDSQDQVNVSYVVQNGLEEKVLTAIAGGELPDIILWDRYQTALYAPKGALLSLDDLVSRDSVDMAQFYEPAVNEMTSDGKLYGIPLLLDARILFYNKDLLSEANVDPTSIKTWDDLEKAAVALTKRDGDKLVQSGFSLKDQGLFNIWITQAGGKLVTDGTPAKTAYNSDQGLAVLDFWGKLYNQDKVYELGFEDGFGGNGFKAGKVAITYDGPWSLTDYKNAGINFGVLEPPVGPDGDKGAFMGGFGLVIPKGAKNPDQAWDFIKWWTMKPENGVEFAKISGWIPANIDAANDSYFTGDDNDNVFVKTMEYAGIRPKNLGYSDVEGLALIPQLQKFMAGEIDAKTALKTAQEQGDQIFADQTK